MSGSSSRLAARQGELDFGLAAAVRSGGPLEITFSRMGHLWEALCRSYDVLGFDPAAGGDQVFRTLVLARIIEPTSKLDSLRVRAEAEIDPPLLPDPEAPPARLRWRCGSATRPARGWW